MKTPFSQLIQDRVNTAYGGNQAEFARSTGFTPQTVNAWLKGRVSLPQIDARRRLAKELGISHVDLLVAMGELDEDEIAIAGVRGVVDERPAPESIAAALNEIDWDPETTQDVASVIRVIAKRRREFPRQAYGPETYKRKPKDTENGE